MVGSFVSFLLVCHTTVVFHIGGRDGFIPSPSFSSVILSISVFPDTIVPSSKGLLKYLFLYASYRLFDSSVCPPGEVGLGYDHWLIILRTWFNTW